MNYNYDDWLDLSGGTFTILLKIFYWKSLQAHFVDDWDQPTFPVDAFCNTYPFCKKILQQPKPFVSISIELYSSSFNKLWLVIPVKFSSIVWGQPRLKPIWFLIRTFRILSLVVTRSDLIQRFGLLSEILVSFVLKPSSQLHGRLGGIPFDTIDLVTLVFSSGQKSMLCIFIWWEHYITSFLCVFSTYVSAIECMYINV